MTNVDDHVLISIVSPVYGAAEIVPELVRRLIAAVEGLGTFEIVLVDDRSPDASWAQIRAASEADRRVRGIRLSRNFGQHRAIRAGLDIARGDYVVVMDCDLQDDPDYIPTLLAEARAGKDIVYTYKRQRRHSWFRNVAAGLYFRIYNALIGDPAHVARMGIGSYSILTRKVVNEYRRLPDAHAHYLMNLRSLGFEHALLEIEHRDRYAGESSYTWRRLVRHAIDGIVSQSVRLLNLSVGVGVAFCGLAMIGIVVLIVSYLVRGALAGYTSLAVLILLVSGLIMLSIGVMGLYIGRIFEQVKGRPLYVVDVALNEPES
jgi:polyisoprenyl-phosphate glycosyltransferase